MAEVSRRFAIDANALRRRNDNPALFTAADRQEARQFAPGAEFVGAYSHVPDAAPVAQIDFHDGTLSAKLSSTSDWVTLAAAGTPGRYRANLPAQDVFLEFTIANGSVASVMIDSGAGHPKQALARLR
jgi:hypothetical protein